MRAIDILAPRIGEIIGGSQREERLDVLPAKIREHARARDEGRGVLVVSRISAVRHGGARRIGLGLKRKIMYLTGMKNIRDVVPFPRTARSR